MDGVFDAQQRKQRDTMGVLHFDDTRHDGMGGVKAGILFDRGYFGVKMGSGYLQNPSKGLPVTLAAILLFDCTTGLPIAVMDGVHITAMRTGAAGGVAAKYLARKDST